MLISKWKRVMRRVVSLYLPDWSTDRLRRKAGGAAPPPEAPLVMIGRKGNRRVVTAADAAAQAAGLSPGMPATKAQVLSTMIRSFSAQIFDLDVPLPASAFASSPLLDPADIAELEKLLAEKPEDTA